MNFDVGKRKVSLGGRRVSETREQVLKRTHAERERRARERLEQKAALSLQSCWRRAAAVAAARRAVRQRWVAQHGAHGERLASQAPTLQGAALRELLFFTDPHELPDVARLAAVGHALLASPHAPGPPALIAQAAAGDGVQLLRLARLVTLAARSLRLHSSQLLPERGGGQPQLQAAGKALLRTLVRALDAQLWQAAGAGAAQRLRRLTGLLAARRLGDSLAHLLLAAAPPAAPLSGTLGAQAGGEAAAGAGPESAARGGPASTSAPSQPQPRGRPAAPAAAAAGGGPTAAAVAAAAATLARFPPAAGGAGGPALSALLCVPLLWARCPQLLPAAGELWAAVSRELGAAPDPTATLPTDLGAGRGCCAAALLGNLAEALAGTPQARLAAVAGAPEAAEAFAGAGAALLRAAPLGLLLPTADADGQEQEQGMGAGAPMPGAPAGAAAAAWDERWLPAAAAGRQLRQLLSPAAVRSLVGLLLPERAGERAGARALALCRLLAAPLLAPQLGADARLALAVTPELVPRLWRACLQDGFRNGRWEGPADGAGGGGEPREGWWALPLLLACRAFAGFLATSPEAAFSEQQRPLPHAQLWRPEGGGLLGLAKHALWQTLWVEQSRGRAPLDPAVAQLRATCRAAAAQLLRQLAERNGRRPFAPAGAFHVAQLSGELFQAEVQRALAKGEFLEGEERSRVWLVLRHAPFLVPFAIRAAAFQQVVAADREQHRGDWSVLAQRRQPLTIRRDRLFWDSFEQMGGLGQRLKERLQIQFVDAHGLPEAGVDGGGLFKDLMEGLVKEGFDPRLGLFLPTADNRLFPNPSARLAMDDALTAFEFLGRVVGKAMYEGIIVELPLAPFFLKQLLRKGVDVNDLATLDAELYRNLMLLRAYEGDVEDLALSFTVTRDVYGDHQERELVPGGRDVPVTAANRAEYILRVANYKLNVETRAATDAFRRGLDDVIEPGWVSMFDEEELQSLIRGRGAAGLDLDELRQCVSYANGYHEDHPTIHAFWQALAGFTPQQQAAWLKFVTACSRAPLLGFRHLSPQLCIAKAGSETDRLPTSATCMNLLKLPPMTSREQISERLLFAIENVAGFDLS